ncbi:hypothetical protein [Mycoplasmopsis primatum]|uniref:hypothetical protein n=1 Tax=Mycoplasmopsis primatum TaxID=55604 RepID=UPI0004971F11|nr:hypothetical protein [Mycoplasmopsis primatum]
MKTKQINYKRYSGKCVLIKLKFDDKVELRMGYFLKDIERLDWFTIFGLDVENGDIYWLDFHKKNIQSIVCLPDPARRK